MKRKAVALALAMIMAIVPAGSAAAGEVPETGSGYEEMQTEWADTAPEAGQDDSAPSEEVQDEIQTETVTILPGTEMSETEMPETEMPERETQAASEDSPETGREIILEDDFLVGVEEVDPNTEDLPTEPDDLALLDTVVEQLDASGYASDALAAKAATFYAGRYIDSYGGQLSGDAKNVYNAMKAAYVDTRKAVASDEKLKIVFETQFPVANSTELEAAQNSVRSIMQSAFDAFIYDYPEVFWMDAPKFSYTLPSLRYPSVITGVTLMPQMVYDGAGTQVEAFDQAVAAMYNTAMQGADVSTAYGKVKAIHDYLCKLLVYDEGTTALAKAYAHSAAGVFLSDTKRVVCEGYAKAFKILCKKAGFESALVVGYTGDAHMWNYIKMDDANWYLVDVTWDDNPNGVPGDTYLLAGSLTRGDAGYTIAAERSVYSNFSGSSYSQNFAVPILSQERYEEVKESVHSHVWETTEEKPTCEEYGYLYSECTICHEETIQVIEPTGHCFLKGTYVYNYDATCTKDGTSSLCCDYGCGTKASDLNAWTGLPHTVQVRGTATGHRFVNYVPDTEAGWYRDSTKTAVCENGCGTKKTVTNPGTALIPTIKVNTTSITLKKGQKTTAVKVSGLAKGDGIKEWKSSNTKIVKVDKNGKITAQKKSGKATITVTLNSGLKKNISVKVQSDTVKTTKISGVPKTLKLSVGKKSSLSVSVSPVTSQEKITYTSSNKKVATVSSKGVITAKGAGKAKITVKSGSKKATVTVTVSKPAPKKITNVPAAVTLKKGRTRTLKPTLSPAGSEAKITYRSSNKSVAAVSSKGKITAKKKGSAVITIKAGNLVFKCKVTVK